ncbi:cytochrome c4 [Nitrogeniibacter mangrovi]|uniref:Cytochrome c4 n=1 Tax=Nitrogeniibacter mangrovi TaxID=2016596 RepID=A0A6C1B714_9RHOO|nr:c-type cytochrome [Nitrogeniibacter mangrovi]QID19552.1 cytochrome c4 [Nitrogeniibacter mangrovi]
MFRRPLTTVVFGLLCALVPMAAQAGPGEAAQVLATLSADPVARDKAIDNGARNATFCANCHGQSGVSNIPDVPNLAAQHPEYLLKQMNAFITGARKAPFMEGLMRALSPQERAELVLFFATRGAPAGVSGDPGQVATGKAAFAQLCARCHGADAHGTATAPRLAGQQPKYLRTSLMRYLTLSGERFYAPMTAQVTKLGEERIEPVIQYLRTLR